MQKKEEKHTQATTVKFDLETWVKILCIVTSFTVTSTEGLQQHVL